MKGLFISFEGNDGSGKSSALTKVKEKLTNLGLNVIYTREPGGSEISERIREVILDKNNYGMDDLTEAYLYAASRREHVVKTIRPALAEGKIILCDRFIDSSLAYQGFARGLGIDKVYDLNQYATEGLLPDLTILVCVHPQIGLSRIKKDARNLDRLELEELEFHNKVYQGYLEVAKRFKDRFVIVNGEKSQSEVLEEVENIVLKFIKEH